MASKTPPVSANSGCSGEPTSEAPRPEAGASNNQSTPGCSGGSSSSTPGPKAGVAINHHQTNSIENQPFARYLILSHSDRTKDITKINPYAIEKAMSVLIAGHFICTRYERTKLIEVYVRSKRQSETLLAATELDCTEFKIPITVTKHKTKNTSKGVVHCDFFADTPRSKLLADMAADKVIEIYRFTERVNGVEVPKDSYCLTFDSEVPPKEMLMGYVVIKVKPYYSNPRLCRKCQRYGHGVNFCQNKQICAKCGEEGHSFNDCENELSCCHCKKNHSASTKTCPMWILEKRILKVATDDRCSYPEARKKVYRDSQDLVSMVPSLSRHKVQSWSNVVATSQQNNNRSQQPTPQHLPFDPASHPYFVSLANQQKVMIEQQKTLADPTSHTAFAALSAQQESTNALLAQMKQQQIAQQEAHQKSIDALLVKMQQQNQEHQASMDRLMSFTMTVLNTLISAQSFLPPASLQALQNITSQQTQQNQLQLQPSISTISKQSSEIQPMEAFSSSSKRLHSDSSEGGDGAEQIKKLATSSSLSSVRHETSDLAPVFQDKVEQPKISSISAPVPQDKGAQAEQPKTASPPASVPQSTDGQTGQQKSKLPVKNELSMKKTDGKDPSDKKGGNKSSVIKKGDKPVVPPKKTSHNRGGPPGSTSRSDL